MKGHLEEATLTSLVAGLEVDESALAHLGECLYCRRRIDQVRDAIEGRQREIEEEAPDWETLSRSILAELPASVGKTRVWGLRRWYANVAAVAAAVMLALTAGLFMGGDPVIETEEIPVEQILAEVDDLLAGEELPGFEGLTEMVPDNEEMAEYFENGSS
jgi:hypothetical protein